MSLSQSVQGCLESSIGALGLPQAALDANLARLEPRLAALRQAYAKSTLPLLRVPEWRDDIAVARDALHKLTQGARTLVFFGTGGSSLGGQTLAQLGGWGIPGDDKHGSESRPRTRFYDNLDARTLELSLAGLDLKTSRFVVISKSGGTPETLVQVTSAIDAVRKAGLAERIPELFLAVTEPKTQGSNNGLRALCEAFSIPTLDHDPNIGGRFSGLTNVGLLPALARGLDAVALREGAQSVIAAMLEAKAAGEFAPAIGASVAIGLAKQRGVRANVMLPYSDRLARFAAWYVQLWGESLGKQARGRRRSRRLALSISTASFSSISTARRSTSSPSFASNARAWGHASRPTSPGPPAPITWPATPRATSWRRSSAPSRRRSSPRGAPCAPSTSTGWTSGRSAL